MTKKKVLGNMKLSHAKITIALQGREDRNYNQFWQATNKCWKCTLLYPWHIGEHPGQTKCSIFLSLQIVIQYQTDPIFKNLYQILKLCQVLKKNKLKKSRQPIGESNFPAALLLTQIIAYWQHSILLGPSTLHVARCSFKY